MSNPNANVSVYYWYVDPDVANDTGRYLPYSDERVPRLGVGKAYYIKFLHASDQKTYTGAYPFLADNHPFPIYLRANVSTMIGTPYSPGNPVVWNTNQVKVRTGDANGLAVTYTVAQAAQMGIVNQTLYRRDYTNGNDVPVPENTTLNPFEGYWFKAKQDCELLLLPSMTRAPGEVSGTMQWHFMDLLHQIGRTDGDGWSVNVTNDAPGFMEYGPYSNQIAVGSNVAAWDMAIDNNTAVNDQIMRLEVFDSTDGVVLASQVFTRFQFNYTGNYQAFGVPFNLPQSRAGHQIEFRTFWFGTAYLRGRIVRCFKQ